MERTIRSTRTTGHKRGAVLVKRTDVETSACCCGTSLLRHWDMRTMVAVPPAKLASRNQELSEKISTSRVVRVSTTPVEGALSRSIGSREG